MQSKVWNFALWAPFIQSTYKDLNEELQKSYVSLMTLKSNAKFEEKLTLGFKNDMINLVNFNGSSGKSEDLHFDGLLLSIAYKVSVRKVQKNYLSWHWKVIQTSKENWLWKIAWGIWWILARAVGSLITFTLMGSFWRKCVMLELQKYSRDVLWKMTYGFKNDRRNLVNFHTSSWKKWQINSMYIVF